MSHKASENVRLLINQNSHEFKTEAEKRNLHTLRSANKVLIYLRRATRLLINNRSITLNSLSNSTRYRLCDEQM